MALFEATIKGSYTTGGTADMVYAFETDEEVGEGILEEFLDELVIYLLDALLAAVVEVLMDNIVFASVELRECTDVVNDTWINRGEATLDQAGQSTGDALPEQIAAYVYFPRLGGGRGGSKFVPGFGEAQNTDGNLGGGALAGMVAFAAAFIAGWTGGTTGITATPVIYSATEGLSIPLSGTAVVKTFFSNQVRRRRDIGV